MNGLPESKWFLLYTLLDEGKSNRAIAKILNVSRTTVRLYAKGHWEDLKVEEGIEHVHQKGGYWHHKKHLNL